MAELLVCSSEVRQGVAEFCDGMERELGGGLVGVYLYGSLAAGCHNGKTSDVDVLVVVSDTLGEGQKQQLLTVHQSVALPMDATYITVDQLNVNVSPTPLQCVIRPVKLFSVPNGLVDFPVVRQDVYVNGVSLVGPAVRSLVAPVPWEVMKPCLMGLYDVALERFKNPVLMLCRIVRSLVTREPCSKAQAGNWALVRFDATWHGLVSDALHAYRGGVHLSDVPEQQAAAFDAYCRKFVADRER